MNGLFTTTLLLSSPISPQRGKIGGREGNFPRLTQLFFGSKLSFFFGGRRRVGNEIDLPCHLKPDPSGRFPPPSPSQVWGKKDQEE